MNGTGSDQCPNDGKAFVRWEWNESTNQFEAEGNADGTNLFATEYKDDNQEEPVEAEWTSSTYDITGAVVGAGGNTCTYEYSNASQGTVETCDSEAGGGQGQGQAAMTRPSGGLAGNFIPAISSLSLLAGAVLALRERF